MALLQSLSFILSLVIGFILALVLGDRLFPQVASALGPPLGHIVLGVGGAFFGGVIHELIAWLGGRD